MYQQLRNLRAMGLVRRPGRVELDGTSDPFEIASHEEDRTGVGCRNGPSPPVFSAFERERREKTHGSSRFDRVDQKLSESSEIGVTYRRNQLLDHVSGFRFVAADHSFERLHAGPIITQRT